MTGKRKASVNVGNPDRSRAKSCARRAFSRVDLLAVVFVVLLLGAWAGGMIFGEKGRTLRCAGNLAALGKAMQSYANENDGTIPAAAIALGKSPVSWDMQLLPHLRPGLAKANSDKVFAEVPRSFLCPSDAAAHSGTPRSYAMAAHDMSPDNWPPGPDSRTGIGLWWDNRTVSLLLGAEAMQKPELLAGVKLSVVPAPADTVVLTEFIDPNNNLGGIQQASVIGAASQLAFFKGTGAHFHRGRFNYLMVDGHVERWSPLQSGALNSSAGIWSLQKEN